VGILCVSALLALPAVAFAHTATAISVPASVVATDTSTYLGTGTVTYLKDGQALPVAGRQVKIHRYDFAKKVWVYIATRGTDSVGAFDLLLPGGETFRYSYVGSRYLAASSAQVRVDLLPGTPLPFVVTIDAGHQSIRSRAMEPIGPGSHRRKLAAVSGTSGRYTHTPEYTRNLQVALKLRDRLVRHGVKVVMVRTRSAVNIANSSRAKLANAAHSDLFVRLHCDGSTVHSKHGISTLTPGRNTWTGPIVARSRTAAGLLHRGMLEHTGAVDRGIVSRTDMAGFNWATVPSVIVEMGFMSNTTEDRRMATAAYQNKLAAGLEEGTLSYLGSR
jgi:N-acetylmuramoyl-L-alanine amidase